MFRLCCTYHNDKFYKIAFAFWFDTYLLYAYLLNDFMVRLFCWLLFWSTSLMTVWQIILICLAIAKEKKWSSKRMKRNAITNATALPPNILQYSNFYNNWSNFSKTKSHFPSLVIFYIGLIFFHGLNSVRHSSVTVYSIRTVSYFHILYALC